MGKEPHSSRKTPKSMTATEKAEKRKRDASNETNGVSRQLVNRCIASLGDQHTNLNMDKAKQPRCTEIQTQTNSVVATKKTKKRKREPPGENNRVVRQLRNRCIDSLDNQQTDQDINEATTKTIQNTKKKGRKSTKLTLKEKISHDAPYKEYIVGEIILATVVGYPPWPARIIDINGHTLKVEFFGTGEINPLRSNAIARFELNKTIPLLKRKGYAKAMRELEFVLGISKDHSVFNS